MAVDVLLASHILVPQWLLRKLSWKMGDAIGSIELRIKLFLQRGFLMQ